jgi:general secretion pathway protein I
MNRRGFTLLEVLVATLIMGIAITGLLTSLTGSLRNTARLTEYDRASMLARRQMDELLAQPRLPAAGQMEGRFTLPEAGGVEAGWKARLSLFESGPAVVPGARVLQRVELQVWWKPGGELRSLQVETYRVMVLLRDDMLALGAGQ